MSEQLKELKNRIREAMELETDDTLATAHLYAEASVVSDDLFKIISRLSPNDIGFDPWISIANVYGIAEAHSINMGLHLRAENL